MKELVDIIRAWEAQRGEPVALATLVRTHGSSYRRPGARMLIGADGTRVGSLSGGCLEDEVTSAAQAVLRSGVPVLLEFDTRRRFGCHGQIEIFIEVANESFVSELRDALAQRRTRRAVTIFEKEVGQLGSRFLSAEEAIPDGAFLQEIAPPIQLILFGHGPDSAPLGAFARELGWSVLEVEQATDLLQIATDDRTAAIVKSHNYGRDCAALRHLLSLDLRYVGLLGPRRRREQLLGDLADSGASIHAQLFSPAGLDLGAETPAEIALALIAEIQTTFADASGEALRERKTPIHGWNLAHRAWSDASLPA
ncbi:MAG: XdhC family protein [Chthoniobacterales bacterium]